MEIQHLALVATEQDLTDLARKYLPKDFPVENLLFRLTPEGVHVSGAYPMFVNVKFKTSWELDVREGKVSAKLVRVKALGLPVTVFKSMILKVIRESAGSLAWLQHEDNLVTVDIDRLAEIEGVTVRSNLKTIECRQGSLFVLSGEL